MKQVVSSSRNCFFENFQISGVRLMTFLFAQQNKPPSDFSVKNINIIHNWDAKWQMVHCKEREETCSCTIVKCLCTISLTAIHIVGALVFMMKTLETISWDAALLLIVCFDNDMNSTSSIFCSLAFSQNMLAMGKAFLPVAGGFSCINPLCTQTSRQNRYKTFEKSYLVTRLGLVS